MSGAKKGGGLPELTKKELATAAGYTYRRLYDIDRDLPEEKKLFVAGPGGKYDLALFVQRWVRYNLECETQDTDDLELVKARHEAVKMQKTALEVDRMRGQLVDVAEVRKLWGDIAHTIMQNLLHLPARLAPRLRMMENQESIAAILDEGIRQSLTELAETPLPDYAAEDGEDEGSEEDEE